MQLELRNRKSLHAKARDLRKEEMQVPERREEEEDQNNDEEDADLVKSEH